MTIRSSLLAALILAGTAALPATARDCGTPPSDLPVVPDGAEATSDELRTAREQVQAHSKAVTEWINCMDARAKMVFTWMTEEQQARWNEDVNAVHNKRVELERSINDQIRAFNQRNNSR